MEVAATPLVPSSPVGNHDSSFSYAQVVLKPYASSSFKLPMHVPVDVDGQPGFAFTKAKMARAAEDFCFALVLKFLRSRPSIDVIHLAVVKMWGLLEIPTISFMDVYHVFIKLNSGRDFVHVWARE